MAAPTATPSSIHDMIHPPAPPPHTVSTPNMLYGSGVALNQDLEHIYQGRHSHSHSHNSQVTSPGHLPYTTYGTYSDRRVVSEYYTTSTR